MTTFDLPFTVVVSDGYTMRSIHPAALGKHRPVIEAILAELLMPTPATLSAAPPPANLPEVSPARRPADAHPATLVQGELAKQSGYSGNCCQSCGSFNMRRTGTCETCDGCGSTSGGCS